MGNTTLEKPTKEFVFDEKEHAYFLDGKPLHGTTTVLGVIAKPALIPWAAKMAVDYIIENFDTEMTEKGICITATLAEEAKHAHSKKKESAGEAGTEAHKEIETIINNAIELGEGIIYSAHSENKQVKKFIDWAIENQVKFLASEQRLYSEEWWTAGTADFICEIKGNLYVGDVKTSSAIYPEHMWQASAYAKMAEEMGMYENFHGVVIVNVPKKGGLNVKENYDLKGNQEAFEACLKIYKQLNAIK